MNWNMTRRSFMAMAAVAGASAALGMNGCDSETNSDEQAFAFGAAFHEAFGGEVNACEISQGGRIVSAAELPAALTSDEDTWRVADGSLADAVGSEAAEAADAYEVVNPLALPAGTMKISGSGDSWVVELSPEGQESKVVKCG